jgi:azurin
MKKYFSFIAFASLLLAASCGSNKQPPPEAPASSGSDLMTEGPAYDPSKIDPAAPVVEVLLRAVGNTMAEMTYDQRELRIKEGSTIHLQLINEGSDPSMIHNFVLIEEGTADKVGPEGLKAGGDNSYVPKMSQVLVATRMAEPKAKVEITFPAPPKGSYDYICTYPGHYQIMNGKMIVE